MDELDIATVPGWVAFRAAMLKEHPEWADYFEVDGPGDRRPGSLCLRIPSVHPQIREPLTVEVPDRELGGGPIDVYWHRYFFEHVFLNRRIDLATAAEQRFARILKLVERCLDDSLVFTEPFEIAPRGRISYGLVPFPLPEEMKDRARKCNARIVYWSWRGNLDGEWHPSDA